VVVDQIYIDDVIIVESKNDAPIAVYENAPEAAQVSGQRM
jgi:hypothetical protein